jgi:hypothetical protein
MYLFFTPFFNYEYNNQKSNVLLDVTSCSLLKTEQYFRGGGNAASILKVEEKPGSEDVKYHTWILGKLKLP